MKGYKASYNQYCRGIFLYEVGKIYEMDKPLICRQRGFHFCENPNDVFHYYSLTSNFVLFEIEAIGEIITEKFISCTNKIHIKRIIPKEEYVDLFDSNRFKIDENTKTSWFKDRYGDEHKFDEKGTRFWERTHDGREYHF
jgi:hypothetical protein